VQERLEDGALVEVLTGWRQTFEGYQPAFSLLVEALRWRG